MTPPHKKAKASAPPQGKKFDGPGPKTKRKEKKLSIDWGNAKLLAGIWAARQTGVLSLSGPRSGRATIIGGGLVDDASKAVVKAALTLASTIVSRLLLTRSNSKDNPPDM